MRRWARTALSRKVAIDAMLEFGLWVGLLHVVVGIVWTFLHYDAMTRLESQLHAVLPAGAELVAFGVMTLLWPMFLIANALC